MTRGFSKGYMRGRLAAALTIVLIATLGSYAVDRAVISQAEAHARVVDALDTVLTTMAAQLVHLGGIRDALASNIAAADRGELARSLPAFDEAVRELREGLTAGVVAPATRALLEDRLLDPLRLLEKVSANAAAVAEDPDLWGERAAFHVTVASDTTMQAVHLIERVKDIERADFQRTAANVKRWRLLGVAVVIGVLALIWARIFGPLEDRVMRDQERLREGRLAAEAASEAKSAFVATVSHEIRTPLVGVLGAAELMRETSLSKEQDELTSTILASGRSLLTILNDVLDFAGIEAGRTRIVLEPTDIAALAGCVGRLFEPQARAKGLVLRVETEGRPAPRLLTDETRLRQVLANLLGNAVKFTQSGTVTLRLRADPPSKGRQALRFEVEDTGIGMAPAELARVWTAFEQVDNSIARRFGGTGLGLAIARRLAEALGGRLTAESEPGRGSTFRLDLTPPVTSEEAVGEDRAGPAAPARPGPMNLHPAREGPDGARPSSPGPLVLVADDNAVNRMIASRILSRAGCRVETACDGAEAIAAFEREGPRLILMDVSMPGTDGIEATRAIRAIERRTDRRPVRIAGVSAHVGGTHDARCREAGMDEVVGKPFTQEDIAGLLARLAPQGDASPVTPVGDDAAPRRAAG